MSAIAVGHCPHCAAVINRNWRECLVCHASITPQTEVITPGEALQRPASLVPTIQPGDLIAWQRADLTMQTGVVDWLYTDSDCGRWAFVTIGESWAAVNMKFVKGVTP